MSQSQFPGSGRRDVGSFDEDEFLGELKETFESYMKSQQALDAKGIPISERNGNDLDRHNDGESMPAHFEMAPLHRVIERADRAAQRGDDRTFTEFPSAFLHLITHLSDWERRTISSDGFHPDDLDDLPRIRREVLKWYAADPDRLRRKRPGGTEALAHGEQGSTKTTCLLYLALLMMQLNNEDIAWVASLDATEWIAMAPYTTVCLPADVEVAVEADPRHPGVDDHLEIDLDLICRDVVRYKDPEDLFRQLSRRTPGQFYAVYPDPNFRKCEQITNCRYHTIEEVDSASEATSLWHWIFAFFEQRIHGSYHNRYLSIMADEVHKFLNQAARKDEHDTWDQVSNWGSTWGDARKMGVSAMFGTHHYPEIHVLARNKIRWGITMGGEQLPNDAPIGGDTMELGLGQAMFWNKRNWAPVEYPDMKAVYTTDAEIHVRYPRYEELKNEKSRT